MALSVELKHQLADELFLDGYRIELIESS